MIGLYIHAPFCVGKCRYCGFYSTGFSSRAAGLYLDALEREAALLSEEFSPRVFSTLYIGGGTPSSLPARSLERLLTIPRTRFRFIRTPEWTAEVNPGSLTAEKLRVLQAAGVNRLSIGVQSFSDRHLRLLGRSHSAFQCHQAFRMARAAGFGNIGLDLIFGIPGQTPEEWRRTVHSALDLEPEHVSAYGLSIEKGTVFERLRREGKLSPPGDERTAAMFEFSAEMLERAGFVQYEVSNFARKGFSCRHNQIYWSAGDYLGLGPSAWSSVKGTRRANAADLNAYAGALSSARLPVTFTEAITPAEASREYLLLALRTREGIWIRRLQEEGGLRGGRNPADAVTELTAQGLAHRTGGRLRLTRRGMLLADEIAERLSA